ncbi:hypothetical protein CPB85DRAFT_1316844 [Mucidula mucida]|nr:hypothetical protein CPB85DRAFT_1316844 [Mucidula mucida]
MNAQEIVLFVTVLLPPCSISSRNADLCSPHPKLQNKSLPVPVVLRRRLTDFLDQIQRNAEASRW